MAVTTFAERLTRALAADARDDKDVAVAAKVPPDGLSRWKNGHAKPKLDNAIALVNTLGVDGHWLLTGEGEMKRNDSADELVARLKVVGMVAGGQFEPGTIRWLISGGSGDAKAAADIAAATADKRSSDGKARDGVGEAGE